ncbi:Connector enhancer of kinase suppressor of ras 2 [Toxocara canis]|uniref:Connector enhancer of kinase suppressor of ras 2 n=1 Tax=Toxocara canis TaxID=6265 RepID=A0A0B2W3P9_TOXCA|nr:Connector enhancer of kinase suppressor of ras 2 [Toxocara canis]
MNIFNVAPGRSYVVPYYGPPTHFCFSSVVESWTVDQVARWMQGTDDSVLPFIEGIAKRGIDGRSLAVLDEETLSSAGVTKLGVRRLILQAVQLLLHFCYAVDTENVQSLSLSVCVSAQDLINEALRCDSLQNTAASKAHLMALLSSLYAAVSRLVDELKNLMNWLDRSPFDRLKAYIDFRMELMAIALALTRTVNASNKKVLSSCATVIEIANELVTKCGTVLRHSKDPLILYTAHIERAVMRRPSNQFEWGFDLQSTYLGVHMISKVKLQSPADACGKIDAGDELLQVNGETVIGWDLGKVVEKIHHPPQIGGVGQGQNEELILLVKKRPRETMPAHMFFFSRGKRAPTISKVPHLQPDVLKAKPSSSVNVPVMEAPDQQATSSQKAVYPKPRMRHRSVSMNLDRSDSICSRISLIKKALTEGRAASDWHTYEKEPSLRMTARRATVCLGTPPSSRHILRLSLTSAKSTESALYSSTEDLSIDIAHCPIPLDHRRHHSTVENVSEVDMNTVNAVVVRRRRTMRQQPDGYVRSFIDNRLVSELDVSLGEVNEEELHPSSAEEDDDIQESQNSRVELLMVMPEPSEYALIELVKENEMESLELPPVRIEEWSSCLSLSLDPVQDKSALNSSSLEDRCSSKPTEAPGSPLRRAKHGLSSRMRSIFSASFKSRSHAPIAESEESSLGWGSDTGDETTAHHMRYTLERASPVDRDIDDVSSKEVVHSSNALRELSKVACAKLDMKQYEGWIRRKRLEREAKPRGKWIKCWMVLRSSAEEADIVIALAKFYVSDAPELKTSKKFVFRLYRLSTVFYFSSYTFEEMKIWMNKLGLATICYDQSDEERKNSTSLSRSMLFIASLESGPRSGLDTSAPPSPQMHHTLPRAYLLSPSSKRKARVERQSSLSSLKSTVSSNLTPPPSSHGFIARSPMFRRHFVERILGREEVSLYVT